MFSFYANKTITTGEGGMVVTRDPALAARIKVMRLHGISRDAFDRFTAKTPSWYYEIVAPGYKYNLTDIAAALGLHHLKRADAFQRRRAEIAARYDEAFAGLPLVRPPGPATGDRHAWHLYVVRLADGAPLDREAFIERLFALGIGCAVHYIPLHQHPYWRERYGLDAARFPHSQRAYERMASARPADRLALRLADRAAQAPDSAFRSATAERVVRLERRHAELRLLPCVARSTAIARCRRAWCSRRCRTTSWRTRCRTRCSTRCARTSRCSPATTWRASTRASPTWSRCSITSGTATRCAGPSRGAAATSVARST